MFVEVGQLKDWFAGFNSTYFDGKLAEPAIAVGRSRTRLGSLSWKYKRRFFSKVPCGYVIRISNYYDMDERQFKSVLLHEMIHLYIVSNGMKDTSPHGVLFRKKMQSINADGWNISVSAKMQGVSSACRAGKKRSRMVLAVAMNDGRRLLSVVSPRYVKVVDGIVKHSPDVKSCSWYVSSDDYFADFPVVRTPRGRIVPSEIYDRLTASMHAVGF